MEWSTRADAAFQGWWNSTVNGSPMLIRIDSDRVGRSSVQDAAGATERWLRWQAPWPGRLVMQWRRIDDEYPWTLPGPDDELVGRCLIVVRPPPLVRRFPRVRTRRGRCGPEWPDVPSPTGPD